MNRRRFLQGLAIGAAGMSAWGDTQNEHPPVVATTLVSPSDLGDQTLLCSFEHKGQSWKVYEDLRVRDGAFTFVRSDAKENNYAKLPRPPSPKTGRRIWEYRSKISAFPRATCWPTACWSMATLTQIRSDGPRLHWSLLLRNAAATGCRGILSWVRGNALIPCQSSPQETPGPITPINSSPI